MIVNVIGDDFNLGATVYLDQTACLQTYYINKNRIDCLIPPSSDQVADVSIVNDDGQRDTLSKGFTYLMVELFLPVIRQ